jgi:hypothetical protein
MERAREIQNDTASRRLAWLAPRRRHVPGPSLSVDAAVTIRYAFPDDEPSLRRLAVLDSAVMPPAPLLLAEVEGQLRAAVSLATGETIADPFHPSAGLIELLRARAHQLTGERRLRSGLGRIRRYATNWSDAQVRTRRPVPPDG